jgi:hypothetical protein
VVFEVKLTFKDNLSEDDDPLEFVHTVSAPEGFEVTGGQLFVERHPNGDFERFSFRIDRDKEGKAEFTVLEDLNT